MLEFGATSVFEKLGQFSNFSICYSTDGDTVFDKNHRNRVKNLEEKEFFIEIVSFSKSS